MGFSALLIAFFFFSSGNTQMAAKHIKPNFSQSQASEMVTRLFSLTPTDMHSLPSYIDQNFFIATQEDGEYVLKIINSEDSENVALIDMQNYAMAYLHQKGLPTQTLRPTTGQKLMSLEENDCGSGCQKYVVRLLRYLPGTTISKAPMTPQLLYEAGRTAATMDTFFQEMKHPQLSVLERETFIWNLSNVCQLEEYLSVLNGDPLQEVVKSVIHQYKLTVEPKRSTFHKCMAVIRYPNPLLP
uniref:Hydroxylysine kinase n=1 Tax=Gouania willdenowi TaxID=441366 RepID=A0A8C5I267_GOUWI